MFFSRVLRVTLEVSPCSRTTPRTRMMMVCHINTDNRQIMPIKELAQLSKRHGVFFLVDGADGPGQLDCNLSELGFVA